LDLTSADAPVTVTSISYDDEAVSSPAYAERRRLIDLYDAEYVAVAADRAEQRRVAHRLRYQVYCLENPFEDQSEHPDGLEQDEFDDFSLQSLLQRRCDGEAIGTVRLILPDAGTSRGDLPFHRLCRPLVPLIDLLLPASSMAEVSRFCISKELRRQKSAGGARLARYATLGLIRSLVEASVENDVTHWCMVVEPALLRFLASLGLQFYPMGPLVEHHGRRQPCHADLAMLLEGVKERRREVWEVITDDGRLAPKRSPRIPAQPGLRHDAPPRPDGFGAPHAARPTLAVA
jgi:N-acyl amino acid synthase of PEP-CTERM/exosortase system